MDERSPSEAYSQYKTRKAERSTPFGAFQAESAFQLDDFQIRACKTLQAGKSVLVAAPTGAGKTVVAQFAVRLAIERGVRVFYTTPIKALSNQKFNELCEQYGEDRVGLLTGDTVVNRDAEIVVMTTEVLRNMIYNGADLSSLGFVVLDEVHYLGDRFRGPVWEEVIIHLPSHVLLVSLSATVSNAEEFGRWLAEVRGHTEVIVSETRPVPLYSHVAVGTDLYPLFAAGSGTANINRDLLSAVKRFRGGGSRRDRRRPGSAKFSRASRASMVLSLDKDDLLPAIFFIFSRNGCDDAVEQCLAAGIDLTDQFEKQQIEMRLDALVEQLGTEDLSVLGFHSFATGLLHGFGAHHAGLIPQFKALVEELFAAGFLGVVFATETLALGINMPARTVVLEKLTKFNGEAHVNITPGEYTQLTGRAGRRGIDTEGHGVVQWHPMIEVADIAALASKRTYALRSQFVPTYNMAANLLTRLSQEDARKVLETSFAQFQADKSVVGLAKRVRKDDEALAGYTKNVECERGDFEEYYALRLTLSDMEKRASKSRTKVRQRDVVESLGVLEFGDVVDIPAKNNFGPSIVIAPMHTRDGVLRFPTILTQAGKVWHLRPHEISGPAVRLGRLRTPKRFNHRQVGQRKQLVGQLEAALEAGTIPRKAQASAPTAANDPMREEIEILRTQIRSHPCHSCPDRETHARWATRAQKLRKERAGLINQIDNRTSSIAAVFDRVTNVLTTLRFLPDDSAILRRIYGERDLLTALTVRGGLWDGLTEPEAAGLAAALVYQDRRGEKSYRTQIPTGHLEAALVEVNSLWRDLYRLETDARLPVTDEPELGLVAPIFRWTEGATLTGTLVGTEISAGDFVRWAKQTLDLLGQVAEVVKPETAPYVRRAAEAIRRGVVAEQ